MIFFIYIYICIYTSKKARSYLLLLNKNIKKKNIFEIRKQ